MKAEDRARAEDYVKTRESFLEEVTALIEAEGGASGGQLAERLSALRDKLVSDSFHIVVMGRFKRGKTTFINSLLGENVLPSSVVPLTSVNTVIRYREEPAARVLYLDGREERIGIGSLHLFVTEKENPENRRGVRLVEVYHPSDYLRDGVCLVDTPGTGSTYLHNDETAYAYLSHADAVIFMISADPPISSSELDFLHHIRGFVDKLFFVLNKVDYLEPADLEESLEFNRQALREALEQGSVQLYPISARNALEAVMRGDERALQRSGLPDFAEHLREFLAGEKGRVLLQSGMRNARKALSDAVAALELEGNLLRRSREDLEEKMGLFREQMRSLAREREELRYLMEGDYRALVRDGLDKDTEVFRHEAEGALSARFEAFFEERSRLSATALLEELGVFVREEIRELFTTWQREEESRLASAFEEIARRYRDRANSLANRILETAGELFGVSFPRLDADFSLSDEGEFWFKLEDVPSDLEILVSALARSLPRKFSHRWLRKSKREELMLLFDRHCGRVRYDFQLRLQKSTNALSLEVERVVGETMRSIERAIENAEERLSLERPKLEAALGELGAEKSVLEGAGERLDGLMDALGRC